MEAASLRDWFEGLTSARVRSMVGSQQENRLLDFKLLRGSALTAGDDRRNFAIALSGFANAEGGVVVWGVDARRDPSAQHIDQVVAAPGLEHAKLALARLFELSPSACSPFPTGVEHRELRGKGGAPSFVATFVPASDEGPHMARLGEDRYYARAGGSFVRMEHFQLADMFGRRARPALEVTARCMSPSNGEVRVTITNTGRGAALSLFVELEASSPFQHNKYGINGSGSETLPVVMRRGASWMHAAGADFVLHPTMAVDIGGVWLGHRTDRSPPAPAECRLQYKVGALGVSPRVGELTVPLLGG